MHRVLLGLLLGLSIMGAGTVKAELVAASSGATLNIVDVSASGLNVISSASIPSDGLPEGFQIFEIKRHPTNGLIYTSAYNPCRDGEEWCWGSARIDKFRLSGSALSHVGPAYVMDDAAFQADGISCAEGDEVFTDYPGQEGFCAPTNFTFSDDGTRLYIDDDELDGVQIFAVDSTTGNLSFLSEGADTNQHGLAYLNGRLYNGSTTISVVGDTPMEIVSGNTGNATEILPDGTLMTAISNQTIEAYSLADPDAPALIDSLATGNRSALDTARSDDASFFVVSGRELLTSVSWDGSTLTQLQQISTPPDPGATEERANRQVELIDNGSTGLVVAAFFEPEDDIDYGTRPTGIELWSVDTATGSFTEVDEILFGDGWTRAVLALGEAGPAPVMRSVPVNATWTLVLMIGLMLAVAGMRMRS